MENSTSRLGQYAASILFIGLLVMATLAGATGAQPARERDKAAAAPAANLAVEPPTIAEMGSVAAMLPELTNARLTQAEEDPETIKWIDGAMQSAMDYNCLTGFWGPVTSESVGYMGNETVTSPVVGEVYYIRATVGGVDTSCAGPAANIEFLLPAYTEFAIDETNKVYCFIGDISGEHAWEMEEVVDECPQSTYPGMYGSVFNKKNGEPWLIPGKVVIVAVPVISSQPLKGMAGNDYLWGAIQAINGMYSPWDNPKQGVFVAGNKPSISYVRPLPAEITSTSAHVSGFVQTNFQPGNAIFELGESRNYDRLAEPLELTDEFSRYSVSMDWNDLKPDTTYHWRIRFVGADGTVVNGEDQTFKTNEAIEGPYLNVSTNRLVFGAQEVGTKSEAQQIELRNSGTSDLSFTSIVISGSRANDYSETSDCGDTLEPGESCTVSIKFEPKSSGSRLARLQIRSDAPGSPHLVHLSGTGK